MRTATANSDASTDATANATASAPNKTWILKRKLSVMSRNTRETLEAPWQRYMTTATKPMVVSQVFPAHHCHFLLEIAIRLFISTSAH